MHGDRAVNRATLLRHKIKHQAHATLQSVSVSKGPTQTRTIKEGSAVNSASYRTIRSESPETVIRRMSLKIPAALECRLDAAPMTMASFYCAFRKQPSKSPSMLFLGFVSSVFLLGRIDDYKQYTPQQTFLLGWHHLQLGNKHCLYLLLLLLHCYSAHITTISSIYSLRIRWRLACVLKCLKSKSMLYVVYFAINAARQNKQKQTQTRNTQTCNYNFIQLQPIQRIKTIYHVISTHPFYVLNIIFILFVLANSKISVILRQFYNHK